MKNFYRSLIILFLFFASFTMQGQNYFYHMLGLSALPNFTWVGLGADANWNTPLNWSNNAAPGVGDTAHFMGAVACSLNCSPTINVSISLAGVDIQSTYAGTITQMPATTITVGSIGWIQSAGTFQGASSNISMVKFAISGGVFNAPAAQFLISASAASAFCCAAT